MAYFQQNTPPPNKVMDFSITNFSGGLNNRNHVLQVNETSDVLNMAFSANDIMEKRFGSTALDALTMSREVSFLDEFRPFNAPALLVRATNNELYFGTTRDRFTLGDIAGVNYAGKYFYCDGRSFNVYGKFPQATSGSYVKVVGTPTTAYRSFYIRDVTPGSFTPLDTTHKQGVTVYNYTTGVIHYEPCLLEINDTSSGHSYVPESPSYIVVRDGRLYLAGSKDNGITEADSDDTVFISDVGNPYYFPVAVSLQLPPNSDKIVGMHTFEDKLVVGRSKDIYVVSGITNRTDLGFDTFKLKPLNVHAGFASNNAIDRAHNFLFFLGNDGNVYLLGNVSGENDDVATQILTKNVNMFNSPINILRSDLSTATSVFYQDTWYLSVKDKVLVYSYRSKAWSVYDGLNARSFYNYNGVLTWGNKDGKVAIPALDYLDFGKPYRAHWVSKQFDMDNANAFKQFRELFLVAHTFDNFISDVYVKLEVDYADILNNSHVTSSMSIWGKSVFGDRMITRNTNASIPIVIGRRGRTIRFTISNGFFYKKTVALIANLETEINPKEGDMIFVTQDGSYYKYEQRVWVRLDMTELNQPMRVYQVNGDYELRGKR